jgi:hypothetical protein
MTASIISITYNRKNRELVKEEILGIKEIEKGFDDQLIKVLCRWIERYFTDTNYENIRIA